MCFGSLKGDPLPDIDASQPIRQVSIPSSSTGPTPAVTAHDGAKTTATATAPATTPDDVRVHGRSDRRSRETTMMMPTTRTAKTKRGGENTRDGYGEDTGAGGGGGGGIIGIGSPEIGGQGQLEMNGERDPPDGKDPEEEVRGGRLDLGGAAAASFGSIGSGSGGGRVRSYIA